MGTVVSQKDRALNEIKSNAAAANSVPALREQVELLTEEVQKLKDALLNREDIKDD